MTAPAPPAGTRPTRPAIGPVLTTEYRLLLRTACTPGRVIAIAALGALAALTAVIVRLGTPVDPFDAGVSFANTNVATLIPVAVLVFGAAMIGDLMDDGSLVYLWLRPVPTWVHVLAAWLATITIAVPLVLLPVVASTAFIDPDPTLIGGTAAAGLVAVIAYAAIFVTLGIRFRRALPWGLVYILIWEGFVASAGKTATKLAIRSYVRSILSTITDTELKLGDFSLAAGIVVPIVVAVAVLTYGARRLARTDIA